jgi:hypothetical protein
MMMMMMMMVIMVMEMNKNRHDVSPRDKDSSELHPCFSGPTPVGDVFAAAAAAARSHSRLCGRWKGHAGSEGALSQRSGWEG